MTKKKITCELINVANSNTLTHLRPNSLKVVYTTLHADKVYCGLKKSQFQNVPNTLRRLQLK